MSSGSAILSTDVPKWTRTLKNAGLEFSNTNGFPLWSLLHSEEINAELACHWSRRLFAVAKKISIAEASLALTTDWNFFSSARYKSNDRTTFLRFARTMSRHISGEPEATRVVSRKPVAQSSACNLDCVGSKTNPASAAAATCGRWLERLTSKSCCAAFNFKTRAPSVFQNRSSLRTAPAGEFFVGVSTQTAFSKRFPRAAATPVFSRPPSGGSR